MNFPQRIVLFVVLLLPILLSAQEFKLFGYVKDHDATAVPYANVLLMNAADSVFIKGSSADENGYFSFTGIQKGDYLVKAKYFTAETPFVKVNVTKDTDVVGLLMQKETLDEVTVVAARPTLDRKPDRIVFNVENTVVSQSSSWDIIRNTPGVISSNNGLQIRGQMATIYLNDRKIQLAADEVQSFLEGLSGTNIKSIEVIPNPPARYDAESGAIVNIVTSKNFVPGYKGSINANYTQSVFSKYSFGTSHYYKTDKLSVFANYNIAPRKNLTRINSKIAFVDASNARFAFWESDLNRNVRSLPQNGNVILDYKLDKRNDFNFVTNVSFSPDQERKNEIAMEMRNASQEIDSTLRTSSNILEDNLNVGLDFTYEHRLRKEGSKLTANVHYTRYTDNSEQILASRYSDALGRPLSSLDFSTTSDQEIAIYTGQLDFVSPLGKASFETGIKISDVNVENTYGFFDIEDNRAMRNLSLSDNFEYRERVFAGYASMAKNWEKWALKIGLRGEQTNVEGLSLVLNTSNDQNYFELFPSFYLSHDLTDNSSLSLDYSRKLQRPDYQDLNPFRYFLNENDFDEGNPDLRPNFSHNLNLNYSLKDTYFFDIYYNDNGAYISALNFQDNTLQTLKEIKQNVNSSVSYGLDFTVSTPITDFWFFYAYSSLFSESETFVAVESNNALFTNTVEGVYLSLNNYLTLSKDGTLNGEMNFDYLSTFISGSYVQDPKTVLNIGLKKSLWNNKAIVSLLVEDVLGMANPRVTSRYLNQDNSYRSLLETQFVRLGFKYNFGNFKLSDSNKALDKKERDRLKN